ncbi:hypothetical protein H6758_02230 [Candidatus Nomurabacteria bacterium]|nr:hypothetical protein [Candidatus Nomurabacteria bacterium]
MAGYTKFGRGRSTGSGGGRRNSGERRSFGSRRDSGGRRDFGERSNFDKHKFSATCGDCGNRCEVPFKPTGKFPVYCSDCFKGQSGGKEKSSFSSSRNFGTDGGYSKRDGGQKRFEKKFEAPKSSGISQKQFDSLHDKLDKILEQVRNLEKQIHEEKQVMPDEESSSKKTVEKKIKEEKPKKAAKKKVATKKTVAKKSAAKKVTKKKAVAHKTKKK